MEKRKMKRESKGNRLARHMVKTLEVEETECVKQEDVSVSNISEGRCMNVAINSANDRH